MHVICENCSILNRINCVHQLYAATTSIDIWLKSLTCNLFEVNSYHYYSVIHAHCLYVNEIRKMFQSVQSSLRFLIQTTMNIADPILFGSVMFYFIFDHHNRYKNNLFCIAWLFLNTHTIHIIFMGIFWFSICIYY